MNITQALTDPQLFAPLFAGPSWRPWKAFLAALFGLPLSNDQLALYRRSPSARRLPRRRSMRRHW